MRYKALFFLLCINLILGFSLFEIDENDKLVRAVNSDAFEQCFSLCKKDNDTIVIYNNLNEFSTCPTVKIACNKTIIFEKSNFKINVNKPTREPRIIFYDFSKTNNQYKFSFLNSASNANLILTLNKKCKIVNFECGNF